MNESPRRASRGAILAAVTPLVAAFPVALFAQNGPALPVALIPLGAVPLAGIFVLGAAGSGRERFWRTFVYAMTCVGVTPFGALPGVRERFYRKDELIYLVNQCPMWMALLFGSAAGTGLAFTIWPPRGWTGVPVGMAGADAAEPPPPAGGGTGG